MKIFHNTRHAEHAGRQEMFRGRMVDCHESPARLQHVLDELARRPVGELLTPAADLPLDAALQRVHSPEYLQFLANAWDEWVAMDPANATRDALPSVWPLAQPHAFRTDKPPLNFAARLGQYAFDSGTPLMAGSWAAARQGAACALAAAQAVLAGEHSAMALTRPPGHHAGPAFMGGYCFINNGAVAAQALRDGGLQRVAVLDVDYHHGNGTQTIFYERSDVLTVSIHAHPERYYPFFWGYPDERGKGAGEGANLNLCLERGTGDAGFMAALEAGMQAIANWGADTLVLALGLDAFEGDPFAGLAVTTPGFGQIGRAVAAMGLPVLIVQEGGYLCPELGDNLEAVLRGF